MGKEPWPGELHARPSSHAEPSKAGAEAELASRRPRGNGPFAQGLHALHARLHPGSGPCTQAPAAAMPQNASGGRGPGAGSSPPVSHVPLTRLPQTMRFRLSPRSTSQPGTLLLEPLHGRFYATDPGTSRAGHCHTPHERPPVSPGAAALGQAGRDLFVPMSTMSLRTENKSSLSRHSGGNSSQWLVLPSPAAELGRPEPGALLRPPHWPGEQSVPDTGCRSHSTHT